MMRSTVTIQAIMSLENEVFAQGNLLQAKTILEPRPCAAILHGAKPSSHTALALVTLTLSHVLLSPRTG